MVRPRRRQQGESVLAQCQSRVGQQRPAMPPKDAGKGAKGKAPPSGDGKISGPKLRTPLDDAEYAKSVNMITAKAPPVYNPNEHPAPVCMGGFWDYPGRRPQHRPELGVLQGKDPNEANRPPAGSGGGGGGGAKGKDAKGAKGKTQRRRRSDKGTVSTLLSLPEQCGRVSYFCWV